MPVAGTASLRLLVAGLPDYLTSSQTRSNGLSRARETYWGHGSADPRLWMDAVGDRPLPEWASEFDCDSWAQFFLKYVISHPAVTCAIPGTTRPEHAIDNQGATIGRLPDPQERQRQEAWFDAL